jgi:multimeric flavodoxin WrbA
MSNTNTGTPVRVITLVCTLKPSPSESSSDTLASQVMEQLKNRGATGETIRIADHDIKPGVEIDMGGGDEWPVIRQKIMDSHILVLATPIWVGHPSSLAQRVLERLDAELSETDGQGRLQTYGKVAVVAVVGNEDGAHHVAAELFQGLNDVGFTIPAGGVTYWVGEAMGSTDFKELEEVPENVVQATKNLAANAVHLANILRESPFPPAS